MTSRDSQPSGFNWRIALMVLGLLIPAVLAFGKIEADVSNLRDEVSRKADASTVDAQYTAILRELNIIESRLPPR